MIGTPGLYPRSWIFLTVKSTVLKIYNSLPVSVCKCIAKSYAEVAIGACRILPSPI